jgi:hypothetical protein
MNERMNEKKCENIQIHPTFFIPQNEIQNERKWVEYAS